jgi:hypothetical protein
MKYSSAVTELAGDIYALRVGLGKRLPTALVVPLALLRNLLFGVLLPSTGDNQVAPEYVVVMRKSDGVVISRVFAGRDFGDGEAVMAAMSRTLPEMTPDEFLDVWYPTRV